MFDMRLFALQYTSSAQAVIRPTASNSIQLPRIKASFDAAIPNTMGMPCTNTILIGMPSPCSTSSRVSEGWDSATQ